MKKKSLITMLVALTLVAAVGIGSTLAYLSSTTETMKNTFTVGNVKITQDESDESTPDNTTDRTDEGNNYTDIEPGDVLTKDPTVTVKANSSDCFVFMKVDGIDALEEQGFTVGDFNKLWKKVSGTPAKKDGIYAYVTSPNATEASVVEKATADNSLPALFTTVTYDLESTEVTADTTLSSITIKSCAIQSANMATDTATAAANALTEATDLLK